MNASVSAASLREWSTNSNGSESRREAEDGDQSRAASEPHCGDHASEPVSSVRASESIAPLGCVGSPLLFSHGGSAGRSARLCGVSSAAAGTVRQRVTPLNNMHRVQQITGQMAGQEAGSEQQVHTHTTRHKLASRRCCCRTPPPTVQARSLSSLPLLRLLFYVLSVLCIWRGSCVCSSAVRDDDGEHDRHDQPRPLERMGV